MAHLRRVAIIALLAAGLALAYSASGQRGPEPVQAKAASSVSKKHVVRRSMRVAYRYWKKREPWIAAPRNYCKPKYIRVKWRRLKDPTVYGRTHIFGCTTLKKSVMVLNKRQEWPSWRLCQVIVHEYGHLAGRLHVKSKRSIMFPHPNRFKSGGSASKIFQICIRAVY